MITKVEIQNFQCHKNTTIDFTDGLNVIAGSSASGKSTVRRAMAWVITNRPSGTDIMSWWVKDGDNIKGETKVSVHLSSGYIISRVRSNVLNGYIIVDKDGVSKTLEAVGTEVPREVQELFNMGPLNLSTQTEAPFLVSQSSSYVAQYINDIVNLGDADRCQSKVESLRKECVKAITKEEKQLEACEKEVATYTWIDKAQEIIDKIKALDTTDLVKKASAISSILASYEEATASLDKIQAILAVAEPLIEKIDAIPKPDPRIPILEKCLSSIDEADKELASIGDLDKAEALIRKIERINGAIIQDKEKAKKLQSIILAYGETEKALAIATKEYEEAEKELSQVGWCPLCGSKLQEITHVF